MPKSEVTNEQLASMGAYQIAEALGCAFSGDQNVIKHGGYFYDPRDWVEHGYANVVEFWEDPEDDDVTHVSTGTIHRLEGEKLESAFQCIGMSSEEDKANLHYQVDACRAYGGIEPDDQFSKAFRLSKWRETRLWGNVRHLIEHLGE